MLLFFFVNNLVKMKYFSVTIIYNSTQTHASTTIHAYPQHTRSPHTCTHEQTRAHTITLCMHFQRPTLTTMSNESWSMCNLHAVRSRDDPAVVENTSATNVSITLQYDTNLPWPGMLYCLRTTNNAREFMLYRRHPALVRNCKPTSTMFLWW